MNTKEAESFINHYFTELYVKRNIDALEDFLHKDYWDDDIGDPDINHLENSKDFLAELFKAKPKAGIKVRSVTVLDNVITAYLEWYNDISDAGTLWMKGIAIFVIDFGKIIKRHTYFYQKNE